MIALLALIASGVILIVAALVMRVPTFYDEVAVAPGAERKKASKEFELKAARCMASAFVNNDPEWAESFSTEQLNSYLEEDLAHYIPLEKLFASGWHTPRIKLEDGLIRFGIRYGDGLWSTVVSLDLKVWLVANQPNTLAVELRGFKAGALPLNSQTVMERIAETARHQNLDVAWYRHNRNPVAILRFQTDQSRPLFQLDRFSLIGDRIEIAGRSPDTGVTRTTQAQP